MAISITSDRQFVTDNSRGGILLPSTVATPIVNRRDVPAMEDHLASAFKDMYKDSIPQLTRWGTLIGRDKDTGIMKVPPYASGFDVVLCRAIVGGYAIGVTAGGPFDPSLSALVTKLSNMAGSWNATVTGKRLARKRAAYVLAHANQSDFGLGEFARQIATGFFVDNKGVAFARLPVYSTRFDDWSSFGMNALPVEGSEKKNGETNYYYIQADERNLRSNAVLEAIDVLDILLTNDKEWPFWLRKYSHTDKRWVWVLCHRTVAGHVTVTSQPANSLYPTSGQSGTWRYLSMLIKDILVQDQMFEGFIAQPPMGFVWLSGADSPTQLLTSIANYQEDLEKGEIMLYPGVLFGSSINATARLSVLKWREVPEGFTRDEWVREKEAVLTQCFWATTAQIRIEAGRGMASQALLGVDAQEEALFSALRQLYESIYNWLTGDEVEVRVIWKSDRSFRNQAETLVQLMTAVEIAQRAATDFPDKPFTPEEIRALFEQRGGIDIPNSSTDYDPDSILLNNIEQNKISLSTAAQLVSCDRIATLRKGDTVVIADTMDTAVITDTCTLSGWVWVSTKADNIQLFVRPEKLLMLSQWVLPLQTVRAAVRWYGKVPDDRDEVHEFCDDQVFFTDMPQETVDLYRAILMTLTEYSHTDTRFTDIVGDWYQSFVDTYNITVDAKLEID